MTEAKSYQIPKHLVWEAWKQVKANRGSAGVDGVSIEEFEKDLKRNLYKIWNRMSSGTYFPPPVRLVEIPKANGGKRPLGIPSIADRVAQTVAKMVMEPTMERIFHPDSYGYGPGRSALDAVGTARKRCWKFDWVIDLDIKSFFDSIPWHLIEKAVAHHTELSWIRLYGKAVAASSRGERRRNPCGENTRNPSGFGGFTAARKFGSALRIRSLDAADLPLFVFRKIR
ncbi:reverse transcriptase domain-containing protein [Bradyrhizobium sp. NBAIM02]|uniref:reverse transcriptase domain-containing protein n=1 Tax=Bradyrhizobium sp. NBAIM02 TaxID=2793817 RepID=UPI0029FB8D8B|nr:hypothetical protein [Bradyrhizobium sp. NBAIM02]